MTNVAAIITVTLAKPAVALREAGARCGVGQASTLGTAKTSRAMPGDENLMGICQ
ncbi:hypothetical protein U5922_007300 [Aquicoccus sp. G2-2]|uniref:hypothetical protein n=1 Tax=Aquicoccus sp. G2-2 TaxID=3092120 RepID=UPI002AE057D0|nr:hypothetical protein [Aquicoccus sp. G2-2]MEA1113291.1 hypothetical protein [Aquicoccus sp. G2-2]